jgi:hypothetical protein
VCVCVNSIEVHAGLREEEGRIAHLDARKMVEWDLAARPIGLAVDLDVVLALHADLPRLLGALVPHRGVFAAHLLVVTDAHVRSAIDIAACHFLLVPPAQHRLGRFADQLEVRADQLEVATRIITLRRGSVGC